MDAILELWVRQSSGRSTRAGAQRKEKDYKVRDEPKEINV